MNADEWRYDNESTSKIKKESTRSLKQTGLSHPRLVTYIDALQTQLFKVMKWDIGTRANARKCISQMRKRIYKSACRMKPNNRVYRPCISHRLKRANARKCISQMRKRIYKSACRMKPNNRVYRPCISHRLKTHQGNWVKKIMWPAYCSLGL